jgi:hypothetical protein
MSQTLPDFEHIIINDEIGHGLYWANRQIAECKNKVCGHYVYVLDDDDHITSFSFIEDFKTLLQNLSPRTPDIIICCGELNEQIFPKIWKQKIERGKIAAPNVICRSKLFNEHAFMWDQPRAGDFKFLEHVLKYDPDIFWWDYEVFCATSGCSLTEEEQVKYGFIDL